MTAVIWRECLWDGPGRSHGIISWWKHDTDVCFPSQAT